jgi:hypothetical protein
MRLLCRPRCGARGKPRPRMSEAFTKLRQRFGHVHKAWSRPVASDRSSESAWSSGGAKAPRPSNAKGRYNFELTDVACVAPLRRYVRESPGLAPQGDAWGVGARRRPRRLRDRTPPNRARLRPRPRPLGRRTHLAWLHKLNRPLVRYDLRRRSVRQPEGWRSSFARSGWGRRRAVFVQAKVEGGHVHGRVLHGIGDFDRAAAFRVGKVRDAALAHALGEPQRLRHDVLRGAGDGGGRQQRSTGLLGRCELRAGDPELAESERRLMRRFAAPRVGPERNAVGVHAVGVGERMVLRRATPRSAALCGCRAELRNASVRRSAAAGRGQERERS